MTSVQNMHVIIIKQQLRPMAMPQAKKESLCITSRNNLLALLNDLLHNLLDGLFFSIMRCIQ